MGFFPGSLTRNPMIYSTEIEHMDEGELALLVNEAVASNGVFSFCTY